MTKLQNIYDAVDDYGLITSAEAAVLGMSNAEMVQQEAKGRFVRVGRGVYRMPVWPFQEQAPYAIAVKAAGVDAYLYGESVIALLGLAPTDPSKMWLGTPKRVRRNLGNGVRLIQDDTLKPIYLEGIACQPVAQALRAAAATLGAVRAMQAARNACEQGYITKQELDEIESELATHEKAE